MKLKEYLTANTMRPEALAKKAHIHGTLITRFLKGQRGLSPSTALKISNATEGSVTISELLFQDYTDEIHNQSSPLRALL